jgi:hypothetical protein
MHETKPPWTSVALRRAALLCALLAAAPALADAPADDASAAPEPRLASAAPLAAAAPLPPAPAPATASTDAPLGRRRHILGLQLDAGVPDVTGVSVIYRPWSYVRFNGGMLYNLAGYGVRGGASIQPYFPIAPSLNVEAGHYFGANVFKKISSYTSVDENLRPMLSDVGYTFVNASLGLELGHPDWFVFFIRGGLSKVWLTVKNANASLPAAKAGSDFSISSMTDPTVKLGIPNVKLGFMLFFY